MIHKPVNCRSVYIPWVCGTCACKKTCKPGPALAYSFSESERRSKHRFAKKVQKNANVRHV